MKHGPPHTARGFTLIEMVLAIGVMTIVMIVINSVFFTALRLRDRTTEIVDQIQPIQRTIAVLRRDLLCVMEPAGILSGNFKAGEVSEPNLSRDAVMELYTATGALGNAEPWADIQKVTYELKDSATPTASGGKDLIRSVTRNLLSTSTPDVTDQRLMGNVRNLLVECYDGDQWMDTWDTSDGNTNLPVAVRIRLELADSGVVGAPQPIEMVVPMVAQFVTNQLQVVSSLGN